jgi:hypothetical protein
MIVVRSYALETNFQGFWLFSWGFQPHENNQLRKSYKYQEAKSSAGLAAFGFLITGIQANLISLN